MSSMSLSEFFQAGGIFMWPILIGLLAALAVALERSLYLLWTYSTPAEPDIQLRTELEQVRPDWLDRFLPASSLRFERDPSVKLVRLFLAEPESSLESRLAAIRGKGTLLRDRMLKRLEVLHTVGALSPLFGLLGTVAGMMEAFHALAASGGQADIATLAGGIWVAMITTAFGLIVAIPAQLLHEFFLARVHERLQRMNRFQDRLLQLYHDGIIR